MPSINFKPRHSVKRIPEIVTSDSKNAIIAAVPKDQLEGIVRINMGNNTITIWAYRINYDVSIKDHDEAMDSRSLLQNG